MEAETQSTDEEKNFNALSSSSAAPRRRLAFLATSDGSWSSSSSSRAVACIESVRHREAERGELPRLAAAFVSPDALDPNRRVLLPPLLPYRRCRSRGFPRTPRG